MTKSILYFERRGEWKKTHKDRAVAVFGRWEKNEQRLPGLQIELTQSGLSRQGC